MRIGGALIRCDVPGDVLVDFDAGDVTVRAPGGRFVAAAAISADRVGVAAYSARAARPRVTHCHTARRCVS